MLLAIDIGNSNTVLGLYRGTELTHKWRLPTEHGWTVDAWAAAILGQLTPAGIAGGQIAGTIIASVVPQVLPAIAAACRRFGPVPCVFGADTDTGMPVLCDHPREIGADRIVNAVAAYSRCRSSLIVIDFGTATTFDAVSAQGEFLGGAIAPGLAISAEALWQRASKLPQVALACPPQAVAKNTVHSMQAGLLFGYVGLVEGLVARMKAELGDNPTVMATGGLAGLVAPHSRCIDQVVPDLTLEGLRIIFTRNRRSEE